MTTSLRLPIAVAAALVAALAVAQTPLPAPSATAKATIRPTTAPGGQRIAGEMSLAQRGTLVVVEGTVTGLTPNGEHGFHIHENGDCSGDGMAAGGHFNPDGHAHANPGQKMRHSGDLFNLKADASGRATFKQEVDTITLTPGKHSVVGKPFVVHAKADDYASQPAGDSGPRLACGIIG